MSMDLGPEERERIISRSAQMMALAREVIRNMHDSPDGPVFGDEPGIPEVVAVAQLIANLNAAGFFRDKAAQPQAAPAAIVPSAEVQKVLIENVLNESSRIMKERLDQFYGHFVQSLSHGVGQNLDKLMEGKIEDAFRKRGLQ